MKEFRLLLTSSILGYGFRAASLRAGLERGPDMIGVDGGNVDPGPHYLGGQTILLDNADPPRPSVDVAGRSWRTAFRC